MQELVKIFDQVDAILARFEDWMHGQDGKDCTEARGIIQKFLSKHQTYGQSLLKKTPTTADDKTIIPMKSTRESEIQHLCELIMNTNSEFNSHNNVYDSEHWYCPFCHAKNYENGDMSKMSHDRDCEYSIARGLMTNIISP